MGSKSNLDVALFEIADDSSHSPLQWEIISPLLQGTTFVTFSAWKCIRYTSLDDVISILGRQFPGVLTFRPLDSAYHAAAKEVSSERS